MILKSGVTLANLKEAASECNGGYIAPSQHYIRTRGRLSDVRAAFIGGNAALRFLVRKPNETPDQWTSRKRLFQNVRLVRTLCSARSAMLYGNPPERSFYEQDAPDSEMSQVVDAQMGSVYEAANAKTMFRSKVAMRRFRDDETNVKLVVNDDDTLRFAFVPAECVFWISDPSDMDVVLGCVEISYVNRNYTMHAYTADKVIAINDSWEQVGGSIEEIQVVPGRVPFVRFGDARDAIEDGSWMNDAILDQRHLINVRSQFALGVRAQAFSQLFVAGRIKGQQYTGEDGQTRIMVSPESIIEADEGSTASFLNPGFPLEQARAVELGWVRQTLESYGVSGYTVDPSGAPEQPMALLIKMFTPLMVRTEDVAEFQASEIELARLTLETWGAIEGVDVSKITCSVEFPEQVLPMDVQAERAADAVDVGANPPRMTTETYVKRHVMQDATDDEVKRYMAELGTQSASVSAQRANVLGALAPRSGYLDRIQKVKPEEAGTQ